MSPERVHVRVEPGVRFGRPHIRGIATVAFADALWAGQSLEEICATYGFTREEMFTALWFEAEHGDYRDRWGDWALKAGIVLSLGRPVDELELPEVPDG